MPGNHKHLHHIINGYVKIPRDHKNEFMEDVLYIFIWDGKIPPDFKKFNFYKIYRI